MTRSYRFARVAVAGGLAGMLALGALGAPSAGAGLQSFASNSSGFALRVTVDLNSLPATAKTQIDSAWTTARNALPADVQAKIPQAFPYVIDQTFVRTLADATPTVTRALSILGEGFQALASKEATSVGESNHSETSVMIPQETTLSVLQVSGGVLKSSVAAGPKVEGLAQIANVSATLNNLASAPSSVLPVDLVNAFDDLADQIDTALGSALTQVETSVDQVEDTLIGALPSPVSALLPDAVKQDLSSALDLPAFPNALGVDLADIAEVANRTTSVKGADDKMQSDARSTIKTASVLGGFITADLIDLSSHSEAMGVAGSAKNSSGCSIANARIGDVAGVSLDGKNLYIDVNGQPVAVPVSGDTVAAIKAQVDGVLQQAGISYKLCDSSQAQAATDGTSATQKVSAFVVEFAPKAVAAVPALGIAAGDTLVKITIDPTVQTSVQAVRAAAAPAQLPVTGASAFGTALFGLAVAVGALIVRRRVLA